MHARMCSATVYETFRLEELLALGSGRDTARNSTAKPAITIGRNKIVDHVTQRRWHQNTQIRQRPWPSEPTKDFQGSDRILIGTPVGEEDNRTPIFITQTMMTKRF